MKSKYISAYPGTDKSIFYKAIDGTLCEFSGGTRAWRNNNPGNLEYGVFTRRHGAIGSDGRFAIFPDESTGWNAMVALLSTATYQKLTIEAAINRYAPQHENNVENYLKSLECQTGFLRNMHMKALSKNDLLKLAKAMKKHEGNRQGEKRLITFP